MKREEGCIFCGTGDGCCDMCELEITSKGNNILFEGEIRDGKKTLHN